MLVAVALIATACSGQGRFTLSWELRAGDATGPMISCDAESQIELEARPEGTEPVLKDRFKCSAMKGTSRPVPADTQVSVVVRYLSAAGDVIAATTPTHERVTADGTTDLGKVVIVKKAQPDKLVINVRWARGEPGNDACVPTAGDRTAVVRRMEWRLETKEGGAYVAGSPVITGCGAAPGDVEGGQACRESIEVPSLDRGEYVLVIHGLDSSCAVCWPEVRVPVVHSGSVADVMVARDPGCHP